MAGDPPQTWLMKSEPGTYSIDDLRAHGVTSWEGVRNYQARNYLRDTIKVGDQVLFYHSSAKPTGVAGLGRVVREAYPDHYAFNPESPYYDAASQEDAPRWWMVDVAFVEKWAEVVSLAELKTDPSLDGMLVRQKGMRLSVQPVSPEHANHVIELGRAKGPTLRST